jgi:hypothetical protein
MEQLATPGTIRLTEDTLRLAEDTLRLAEGFVQVRPLGPIPVKGLAEPVAVFELIGAAAVRTRLQASRARGLTRFVGRDAEMEQLRQAAEQAGRGRGQVAAVVGEPGVGKSRLFLPRGRAGVLGDLGGSGFGSGRGRSVRAGALPRTGLYVA